MMEGYQLSPQQKRLYMLQEADAPYLAQVAILIEGPFEVEAFEYAVNELSARNQILRTSFQQLPEMDLPIQVVSEGASPAWKREDLSNKRVEDQEAYVEEIFEKERYLLHDFERGAISSIYLLKLSPERHVCVLNLCSLCADAWTLKALVQGVAGYYGAYQGEMVVEDEPLQYIQFSEWQNSLLEGEDEAAGKEFWSKHRFWQVPGLLLPYGNESSNNQLFSPDVTTVIFRDDINAGLRRISQKYGVSIKAILLACWQTILWRFTYQVEIAVGALFDGRKYKEMDRLLGLVARYLPVVGWVEGAEEVIELIRRLDDAIQEADEWQESFILGQSPKVENDDSLLFFPTGFDYVDLTGKLGGGNADFSIYKHYNCIDRFNLKLACSCLNHSFVAEFHYDPAIIDSGIIQSLAASFEAALRNILEKPETSVSKLSLLNEVERQKLVDATTCLQTDCNPGKCVHKVFEEQVAQTPDRVAVVFGDRSLTYSELNAGANRLAQRLRSLKVKPETKVGICMERSPEMIIALLGVLKAGGAYVPLDPAYPVSRLAYMLEDSEVAVLLTQTEWAERFRGCKAHCLYLDTDAEIFAGEDEETITGEVTPENAAYVIYTSGSTGRPKGAVITHKGLLNYLTWCVTAYDLRLGGAVPVHSSIAFDFTITTIFAPLIVGQQLLLVNQSASIASLAATLRSETNLNLLKLTPGHLRLLSQELTADELASLTRSLVIGGEALMAEDLFIWQRSSPKTAFFNEYGPTETVVGCCVFRIRQSGRQRGAVPIGCPIANTQLYLLDTYFQLVPLGAPGEIYIGGEGIARGYLKRAELTAQQFLPNPFSRDPGERLYKTGDLGRCQPDGNLEFIGRIDEQVKIRGYRVEPGEIEGVIKEHPGITDCAVVAKANRNGSRQLAAYYVRRDSEEINEDELRRHVEDKLPEYMWIGRYEELEEMPLNENGKVDRKRLKEREQGKEDAKIEIGQREEEEILQGIWRQVLGVKQVRVEDRYFALGGDSIRSIQILTGARERGLNISVQDLYEHQTISEIVKVIRERRRDSNHAARSEPFGLITEEDRKKLPADVEDAYPLTMLQAGMIYHMQANTRSPIYHDVFSFHLKARLEAKKMERAVKDVVKRHPALRTTFDLFNYSEALQLVRKEREAEIGITDLRAMMDADQEEEIKSWVEGEKNREFDIEKGPLLRIHLHIRSEERFQFTLSFHHAILDGWSDATLTTELFRHYLHALEGIPFEIQPPAASFRDYIALEREAIGSMECEQFWTEKLKGNTFLALPRLRHSDRRNESRRTMMVQEVPIPEKLSEGLKALALTNAVPLKTVLLAAHLKVMSAIGGQSDVLTSMVSAGRPEQADGERVLGLHINSLPFRLKLAGGTWLDLIRATFETERDTLPYRRYPMAELKKKNGGRPLSETIFYFTHYHIYQSLQELTEVHVLDRIFYEETSFALVAYFRLDPFTSRVHLDLTCDGSELNPKQIESIGGYYLTALEAMVGNPNARYETVSVLSEREVRQLLAEYRDIKTENSDQRCVHRIFEEQVRYKGDQIAAVCEDSQVSYKELDRRANQMGQYLKKIKVGPEKIVGILMSRRVELMVSILGVLKSGGGYLPIDEQSPESRIELMLEEAGVEVVITEEKLCEKLPEKLLKVINVDQMEAFYAEGADEIEDRAAAENIAYVIYTSGTTGRPKGVMVTHSNLVGLFEATEEKFRFDGTDVWSMFHSAAFDFSVWEMWGALLKGGRLIMVPYWASRDPAEFYKILRNEKVTILNQTPSAFTQLIERDEEEGEGGRLNLRVVILGGEAVEEGRLRRWKRKYGVERPELVNMYGITETTVHVSYHRESESAEENQWSIIGRAIEGDEIYILDERQELSPVGVVGEIFVGGRGLGRGYIGNGGKTAESYMPNPYAEAGGRMYRSGDLGRYREDGDLEYVGRKDRQVKVRGYRIELPEIECHLTNHPGVQKAAVVVDEIDTHDKRLRAFVLPDQVSASPIRRLLRLEKQGTINRHNRFELPNGFVIAHKNKSETEFMFKEIFEEKVYLRHGITIEEGDVVFDVGANIGLFTLFASEYCGRLQAYAFEPIPQLFDLLRLNASIYDLNVNLFDCGLSVEAGQAAFTYYPNVSVLSGRFANTEQERNVVRSFLQNERLAGFNLAEEPDFTIVEEVLAERLFCEPVTCHLKTISQVIQEQAIERIDLLKIDVEKSELDVLSGISDCDWARIRQIVVEVHDLDGRLNRVSALLEKHGYNLTVEQDRLLKDTGLYNIYAVRPSKGKRSAARFSNGVEAKHDYTWRNPSQLIGDVRNFLRNKLPDYMIPSGFVLLDEMPLTSNEKIDYKALPADYALHIAAVEPQVSSSNWVESELTQIWRATLKTQTIGIYDNFFELGGDSILSIQIIAKAKQKGIHLTPKQIFQYPTIVELASIASTSQVEAEQGGVTGALPLTPIQHWFFEQGLDNPSHFNQAVFLKVERSVAPRILEIVWSQLIVHHDALRLRFRSVGSRWEQYNAPVQQPSSFMIVDLSNLPDQEKREALEQMASATQTTLDISQGPLAKAVYFDLGPDSAGRLLILAHHLAIDGVSWRILLEDLQTAYEQFNRDTTINLSIKTSSFKEWARRLKGQAQTENTRKELPYWKSLFQKQIPPIPLDCRLGDNSVASTRTIEHSLTEAETLSLLRRLPQEFHTQVNVALLAALAEAFSDWTGERRLFVDIEGHGREDIIEGIDASRTVGWFTTIFPSIIELEAGSQGLDALRAVKGQLRNIPNRGIGYGLLRYLCEDRDITDSLRANPGPEILFNYMGQLDQILADSPVFKLAAESIGLTRGTTGIRSYLIEINARVIHGRLQIEWMYSESRHKRATIEKLARKFMDRLRSHITPAESAGARGSISADSSLAASVPGRLGKLPEQHRDLQDCYRLSAAQQGMIYHTLCAPKSGVYSVVVSCVLEGDLNLSAFKQAWQQVVDRHPTLRTSFVWEGVDEPLQIVHTGVEPDFAFYDRRWMSPSELRHELEFFIKSEREKGFELSSPPLMRFAVIRVEEAVHRFVWSFHHAILDGWSGPLLLKQVFAFYRAFCRGRDLDLELGRPYRDYINWLEKQDRFAAERYWRQTLDKFAAPNRLWAVQGRASISESNHSYGEEQIDFSERTTSALRSLARKQHVTINTLVQATWALALGHFSGDIDLVFGTTVSGRPPELIGSDSMVGVFINTLPTRVRIYDDDDVFSWLKQLQDSQVEMRQYEYSSLVDIHKWSGIPRDTPMFEYILVFENYPAEVSLNELSGPLKVLDLRFVDSSHYPLTLTAALEPTLLLRLNYDRRYFGSHSIGRLLAAFRAGLRAFIENPAGKVGAVLSAIAEADRQSRIREEKRLEEFSLGQLNTIKGTSSK